MTGPDRFAPDRFGEDELHAYVDGRLPADRSRLVADYLERNADEAARVADYAAHRDALRVMLQPKFDEPIPHTLRVDRIAAEMRRGRMRRLSAIAALVAVAITGIAAGWIAAPALRGGKPDTLVAEAIAIRHGDTQPEERFDAPAVAAPDTRDGLVARVLSVPAKVPDLAQAGYALAGIAIYPDRAGSHALQVTYRKADGSAFTLYMRRSVGSDRFDLMRQGSMQICVWQNDDLSVVMLGEMSAKEMLKVATLTYADLNF